MWPFISVHFGDPFTNLSHVVGELAVRGGGDDDAASVVLVPSLSARSLPS